VTAASLLGTMGPGAEAAVPALAEAVKDSDTNLAVHAANALKRIDPQAAAEAGVP
jgi:HEAT repeat protein